MPTTSLLLCRRTRSLRWLQLAVFGIAASPHPTALLFGRTANAQPTAPPQPQTPNPPPLRKLLSPSNPRSNCPNAFAGELVGQPSKLFATISNATASSAHAFTPTNATKKPNDGAVASTTKPKKSVKRSFTKNVGWLAFVSDAGCASSQHASKVIAPSKKSNDAVGN